MIESSTVTHLYYSAALNHSQKKAFHFSLPGFKCHLTYSEVWQLAWQYAKFLKEKGILPKDRVGIWACSSWRWEVAQLAILICEAVVVGIDLNEPVKNFPKLEELTELKFILYEEDFLVSKWSQGHNSNVKFLLLPKELAAVRDDSEPLEEQTLKIANSQNAEAFIIFTSGTTSAPKAIAYSHQKMIFAIHHLMSLYPEVNESPRALCWLPLANLFQRMVNFSTVAGGGEIFFIDNPIDVLSALNQANPDLFVAVPRFYEKVFYTFQSKIKQLPFPLNFVISIGIKLLRLKWKFRKNWLAKLSLSILLKPWNLLVFQKFKGLFGNRLKILISGSAPLKREINEFFCALEIPILEAYGTSENVLPIAANRKDQFRIGSVGQPVLENSVVISDEGEVLVKGHGVFSGYLKKDSTESFINGYYRTGDLGFLDSEGFLYLLGRKSEMFKTDTGKKVATSDIESVFKNISFLDQVVVLGEGRKVPFVILTIDFSNLAHFLKKPLERLFDATTGSFTKGDKLKIENEIRQALKQGQLSLAPGGAILLVRKLSLEGNEVTPNLKIKRSFIEKKFQSQIENLYSRMVHNGEFAIQMVDSYDQEVDIEIVTSPAKRSIKVALLMTRIFFYSLPFIFRIQAKEKYYRLVGSFLREALGGLKGPFHKLGQMLGQMPENIPAEIAGELKTLFRDSQPVNSTLIKSIVEKELRKPIPALFLEWLDRPIATGSIGQVHWARLLDGQEVAVKVLIPQMDQILKSDLRLLKWAVPFLKTILNFKSLPAHFEELKELMESEVDLEKEALNYQIFGLIFKEIAEIVVPKVFTQYCTSKVLVTQYINGQSFEDFANSANASDKNQVARIIWRSCSFSINRYAIFNADPHPGNFLILKDAAGLQPPRVAMVDFGFCKVWTKDFMDRWKRQVLACCRSDLKQFKQQSIELGLIHDSSTTFHEELYEINHQVIYKPWMKDEDFHFTEEWLKFYLRSMLQYQILVPGLQVPQQFLALSRLYWSKFNLMVILDAKTNFYQLTIPDIEGETRLLPTLNIRKVSNE